MTSEMFYVSSSAMDMWARNQTRFWGCCAVLAKYSKVNKKVRPKSGPISQSFLRVELIQQQMKIMFKLLLECEHNKTVEVWPAEGRLVRSGGASVTFHRYGGC